MSSWYEETGDCCVSVHVLKPGGRWLLPSGWMPGTKLYFGMWYIRETSVNGLQALAPLVTVAMTVKHSALAVYTDNEGRFSTRNL